MLLLPTSTMMKLPLLSLLLMWPTVAQEVIVTVTESEYQELIRRVLPCPPLPRGTDSAQLCLRIIPPGHRSEDRELLVILRDRGKTLELEITQPEPALAHSAAKSKASHPDDWMESMELHMRSWRTSDVRVVEQILGKSWRQMTSRVVPSEEWFTDPTRYYFRAQSLAGTVTIDISWPGAKAARQASAFLNWAERVRKKAETVLNECGGSRVCWETGPLQ